ncbi:LOW QUALITY PROTEIN: hypothetical protein ACHAWF_009244 [Thalassiosira exigua]
MLHRRWLSESGHDDEIEPPFGVLFPWFAVLIGILLYYLISRFANVVPYTAAMFVTGNLMGYFSTLTQGHFVVESINMWLGINGEVILLVFLPGLLFLDSFNINVYLFRKSFSQLLTFAFPMVLAGTSLTALVAFYVFPYGWSFDLCMTFGSILAATDPVAVAVLLNELGAPPRLKTHIAGESLLNDGSAVVFFHIFSSRFFHELGVDGFGKAIGWAEGFIMFLRLSLGGACIGIVFGTLLVTLLFNFNRRLSQEENVIQVTSTITIAYLSFFVSEVVCHCSGIISVVFCGVTVKAFGETLLNDLHLTHDFWHISEHLLNSILFTLGGAVWARTVWGGVLSTEDNAHYFGGADWLYLLLLYVSIILIRFVLLFLFFPIVSKLGVGTNWREAVFMGYGGLRVGIALALLLSAEVFKYTEIGSVTEQTRTQYREFSERLFGMVGGVSFLTLVINGPTSGPLLRSLGLVTPTEARKRLVDNYLKHTIQKTLVSLLSLLSDEHFQDHVSILRDITGQDLDHAYERHQLKHPNETPNLTNIACYVATSHKAGERRLARSMPASRLVRSEATRKLQKDRATVYDFSLKGRPGPPRLDELGGFVIDKRLETKTSITRVLLALSLINAHLKAQETFKTEFASVGANSLTLAEKSVIDESREQGTWRSSTWS